MFFFKGSFLKSIFFQNPVLVKDCWLKSLISKMKESSTNNNNSKKCDFFSIFNFPSILEKIIFIPFKVSVVSPYPSW